MPNVGTDPIAGRGTYIGLFLVTLATLMYEILLTRIFSVTVNYHSAFFAISVAMLGMTVGALIVYLKPSRFAGERVHGQMLVGALLMAVFMVLGFLFHLTIPFYTWWHQALTCLALALPFIFGGITVCLALTKFPWQVGSLYAADLAGAALGCLALIWLLDHTDAGTTVIVCAALASLGAACFSSQVSNTLAQVSGLVLFLGLGGFALYNTRLVDAQESMLRLLRVKGQMEVEDNKPDYIKWNSFSRIQVSWNQHQGDTPTQPFGWGLSDKAPLDRLVRQRSILIDASAATVMTEFGGELTDREREKLEFLKFDVSNLAHHLLDDATVLVVGAGGGRDLLSALVFDQRRVIGVEINDDILRTVNGKFGKFTGHLDRNPKIELVNDEARSYIARQPDRSFDLMQVSLIDTWAATAAGAFALTENSLYTVQAWQLFLGKLTDRGMLSFSRWYFQDRPGEAYRLAALASTTLLASGVANPREHIVLVKSYAGERAAGSRGVATILVGRRPLQAAVLDKLEKVVEEMDFEIVVSPRQATDATFEQLASGKNLDRFAASFPLDISAPTDERPFFFNMLRLRDLLVPGRTLEAAVPHNLTAVQWLGRLLVVVCALTLVCIVVPLLLTMGRLPVGGSLPLLLFFSGIGLGFLLIEISLMQRLILFLGHPTYGLAVVLFALLLSGGVGAYLSQVIGGRRVYGPASLILLLLLAFLYLFGTLAGEVIAAHEASTTQVRIMVAGGLVFLLGLPMGTAFPFGIRMAERRDRDLTPWLWGINGATSVCASVLATAISLTFGIATAYWSGAAGYGLALLATLFLALTDRRSATG